MQLRCFASCRETQGTVMWVSRPGHCYQHQLVVVLYDLGVLPRLCLYRSITARRPRCTAPVARRRDRSVSTPHNKLRQTIDKPRIPLLLTSILCLCCELKAHLCLSKTVIWCTIARRVSRVLFLSTEKPRFEVASGSIAV